jgi:general stress protein 26
MGDTKNLLHEDAVKKIKELAEDAKICMFNTSLADIPFSTRPMGIQKVEDDGSIWFMSASDSKKNKEISDDRRIHLTFMNNGASEYLSVYGNAEIIIDKEKARELWNPIIKAWFHDGPEDANLTLIRFEPERGYYWDTKSNKMISMLKIAVGALTGKTMDDGLEGKINL